MEFLAGMCVGAIALIATSPVWIQIALLLLWGLDFMDMDMRPTKPGWLQKLEDRLKGKRNHA